MQNIIKQHTTLIDLINHHNDTINLVKERILLDTERFDLDENYRNWLEKLIASFTDNINRSLTFVTDKLLNIDIANNEERNSIFNLFGDLHYAFIQNIFTNKIFCLSGIASDIDSIAALKYNLSLSHFLDYFAYYGTEYFDCDKEYYCPLYFNCDLEEKDNKCKTAPYKHGTHNNDHYCEYGCVARRFYLNELKVIHDL